MTTISESLDRKSTRLNSSHQIISYAVFCLKKKKNNIDYVQDKGFMTSVADGIFKKRVKVVGGFGIRTLSNLNVYFFFFFFLKESPPPNISPSSPPPPFPI